MTNVTRDKGKGSAARRLASAISRPLQSAGLVNGSSRRSDALVGPPPPPSLGGFRVAADIEIRSKKLEQDLAELRERHSRVERELWRARRSARASKALSRAVLGASSAGIGAAIASVVALGLYLLDIVTAPPLLLGTVIVGSVFRILLDARRAGVDDDFPPAPPPRMY